MSYDCHRGYVARCPKKLLIGQGSLMGKWDALYGFWFGELSEERGEVREFWFSGSPEIDRKLAALFSEDYNRALEGSYDDWRSSVRGCLTLIILLDQIPRNIFRGQPESFKTDTKALEIAREFIKSPWHEGLIEVEKLFAYLPFQHSENRGDQALSVKLYSEIPEHDKKEEWLDFAVQHKTIIDAFGRFPHRNAILKRENTPREAVWLAGNDQRFGTIVEGPDDK